ncbi:ABC transporter substrate-binding protein [Kingella kingae]|uniref:ABC transporter substrate-binding protein n=1 Tax=Kingella kingae TaxID=504 RepID=UPI00030FD8D9|nr:ABC transporter substrate-binding protein [Kingella kingae]MDK4554715.1 ABC transporter substrate-binding protein [Kingella kingae]MDK4583804.1 ABC transporter substrate-binding protein [Kingella kingae]MDK4587773.1 ABC transporter substrate-binding protein [Kingella kingae]MDK4595941.1 ABC transporter substrate-binding protein [Kingella kingae]MDK4599871.1 ABC transporter substrate-binding protein [Kingella kingae]
MKKTLLSTLVLMTLAACGGQDKTAQTPATPAAGASAVSGATVTTDLPQTDTLNIYNWSNYVDESTVEDFKNANNLNLTYDLYENNETLEAKMLTGKSGYDLGVPGIAFLPRQIQAGAYQKINRDLIPNYKNIDPALLKLLEQADPGNQYAVPYFSGANTLAITAKGKEILGGQLPENGWDLLFKPEYTNKLKACGIALWDTPSEMFPIVLNYIGKDPRGTSAADIDAAAAVLQAIRPDIKRFSASYIDELARGDICLVAGNGGDLNMAKARSEEVKNNVGIEVLTPKGMGFWVESWVIPADAKNVLNAHKYINYTLDPEIAAKNGAAVTFAPASLPAREKMDAALVATRSIFPTADDMANGFVMPQMSDEAKKQTTTLWQKLKVGN